MITDISREFKRQTKENIEMNQYPQLELLWQQYITQIKETTDQATLETISIKLAITIFTLCNFHNMKKINQIE